MDDIVFERRKGRRAEASTATRICQKCLHNTHWTYECLNTTIYLRRPSKTEEIRNPRVRAEVIIAKPPDQREIEQLEKEVQIMREMKEKKKLKKLKREAKNLEKEAKKLKREKKENEIEEKGAEKSSSAEESDEIEESGGSSEDSAEGGVQSGSGSEDSVEEWVEER